ncbi:phosphotransferase family protein [Aspergillus terreus]|uniref:Phosphotransferase family protein n=1 Tax=Aspergillus terreus TaxID=33178 RepID=A0A5M3YPU3_ASPTE|nr:hypothetical protein ATETN484_0002071500 [Aspergillus terreus]GFF15571.1 phosphotransferase family protein [Aspergillus terreus]
MHPRMSPDDVAWEQAEETSDNWLAQFLEEGLPRSKLPGLHTTFDTASSYLAALADLNLEHLIHQRNDAVESADDCRRKFIARKLFLKLAKNKRLTNPSLEKGPSKTWCDDLRPANILLNEDLQIVGVVDWEFTYAAPAEFMNAPPWWLLIEKPECWPQGLEDWTSVFAFDTIYWQKIDPRFFGPSESPEEAWRERPDLLDAKEKEEMEDLVARKLEEMKSRVLAWDPDEYTVAFRQQMKERREQATEANELDQSKGID